MGYLVASQGLARRVCSTLGPAVALMLTLSVGAASPAPDALEAGQRFLAENATKPGVVTRPSGLQYEILTVGNGPKPGPSDVVTTHYHGTLIDGTVFDSSVERGQPISFPVQGVIPGWVEALQLMPVGSKWRLFVPSELAYGKRGAGGAIGPNEVLVFEVELLSIGPS
jgi:FKBP-type peptidyl-prolyl cis-trans isomerase FklB